MTIHGTVETTLRVASTFEFTRRRRLSEPAVACRAMNEPSRRPQLNAVKLRAFSSRGSWDGAAMTVTATPPAGGPVAALTRASIRPFHAWSFWRNAPPAELSLAGAQGCRLAAGLGEAPLLRQATFTIWDSIACMDAYARSGAHLAAIRAAHRGHYFSESMFVRFVPYAAEGEWKGRRLEL